MSSVIHELSTNNLPTNFLSSLPVYLFSSFLLVEWTDSGLSRGSKHVPVVGPSVTDCGRVRGIVYDGQGVVQEPVGDIERRNLQDGTYRSPGTSYKSEWTLPSFITLQLWGPRGEVVTSYAQFLICRVVGVGVEEPPCQDSPRGVGESPRVVLTRGYDYHHWKSNFVGTNRETRKRT